MSMDLYELAMRLGLALALGFVIGLERGWKERDEGEGKRAAGLRTFSLLGLLGGIFGMLSLGGDRILIAAGFVTTSAVMAAFIWRENQREGLYSATTMVAALVTFMLGALAVMGNMTIAAGAGVVTVGLLAYKSELHGFLSRLTWSELRSGLLLAAMTFIALPLLPDKAIDPWGALNPHQLWLITILIAAVSFAGYVAVKLVGPSRGLVLAAALGGLISSTVVTLTLARLAKDNAARLGLLSGSILAVGCGDDGACPRAGGRAEPVAGARPRGAASGRGALPGLRRLCADRAGRAKRRGKPGGPRAQESLPALRGAALRRHPGVVMLAAGIAKSMFGDSGLMVVAAISGLADVDAITLSVANMGPQAATGVAAVLLASASTVPPRRSMPVWRAERNWACCCSPSTWPPWR